MSEKRIKRVSGIMLSYEIIERKRERDLFSVSLSPIFDVTIRRVEEPERGILDGVFELVTKIFNTVVSSIDFKHDEFYNIDYIEVTLETDAKKAMEIWLKLIDILEKLDYNVKIFVKWNGKLDLDPEELGYYMGKALAKMNLKLKTEKSIDAVRLINEIRE